MNLAQVLSTYVSLNLMVALGFIGLRVWWIASQGRGSSAAVELKLNYVVITAITIISLAHPFFPRSKIFEPAVKVWSAKTIGSFPSEYTGTDSGGYLMVPTFSSDFSIPTNKVSVSLVIITVLISCVALVQIARDIYSLVRIRQRSFKIRRYGSVTILMNDDIKVPFSSWLPGRADVVIPSAFLSKPQDYKIAVAHELQHHRQGDTRWVYVMWALKVICAINPFVYLWNRWISELQEFACDETLVDQNKVESQQYARCLVEVAETANNQNYFPSCAVGLVFLVERNLLKRRIERMINMHTNKKGRSIGLVFGSAIVALMVGVAYASNGFVQDRRVSMADAQRFAESARGDSEFPVVVNDLVLKHLNRYIGTPEGRVFMRVALQRMQTYRSLVEAKIKDYQVPAELMAIPIIESGYQNLEQSNNQGWGAGIWMFLASTARAYGLRVDDQVDERLNVELLTDSAMRYLKGNELKFKDWHLSVLSFNIGEKRVLEGIKKTGSRDAWVLVRNGFENDKDYLPKLMAAILIMKNPESVE